MTECKRMCLFIHPWLTAAPTRTTPFREEQPKPLLVKSQGVIVQVKESRPSEQESKRQQVAAVSNAEASPAAGAGHSPPA